MLYEKLMENFRELVEKNNLFAEEVVITGRSLSAEEAIGNPKRQNYPIQKGKEKLMQAEFKGKKGQAFTDMPGNFFGTLKQVLNTPPENNFERAVLISTMNAVCKYLGIIDKTVHCRNEEPEECAAKFAEYIKENYGNAKIAFIGLQPAMLEAVSQLFAVRAVDLDADNIGKTKYGVLIEDFEKTDEVLAWCDLILATSSTVVNATITNYCNVKPVIFFGTSGAAATHLMGLERWCYKGL